MEKIGKGELLKTKQLFILPLGVGFQGQYSKYNHLYNQQKPCHQSSQVKRICHLAAPALRVPAPWDLSIDFPSWWHPNWHEEYVCCQNWYIRKPTWKWRDWCVTVLGHISLLVLQVVCFTCQSKGRIPISIANAHQYMQKQ